MILETISVTAGKELFKCVVTDAWQAMSKVTSAKLKLWNTEAKISDLYKKIGNVRRVKTIWQVDKAVDISSFYCDSHVVINKSRKIIDQLDDFGTADNLLIEGIAGQGKSIFLRYLCAVALAQGRCIPIFVELRKISERVTLMDRIFEELANLGLTIDKSIFHALAQSGKIILFLDAFDEIPEKEKKRSLAEMEDLASRYDMLQIIATSRPHNPISMSHHFTNVKLDNFQNDEYKFVIQTLSKGDAWADTLIEHIEKRAQHIRTLLCTPLMVTLLVLTYKSHKHLPNRLAGFYDSLFFTLLQRHDGTKPGFTRHRACDLDDEQYRQVFEALCIISKENPEMVFTYKDFYNITQRALDEAHLKEGAAKYLDDIIKITCLIVHDGDEHRFIHKTVQEYYAAAFIEKKPDAWARKFYQRMTNYTAFRRWQEELFFLREIDRYRYNKYFMLPIILKFINVTEKELSGSPKRLTPSQIEKHLEPYSLIFDLHTTGPTKKIAVGRDASSVNSYFFADQFMFRFFSLNLKSLKESIVKEKLETVRTLRKNSKLISFVDVFRAGIMQTELISIIENNTNMLFAQAKEMSQQIALDDGDNILTGLI